MASMRFVRRSVLAVVISGATVFGGLAAAAGTASASGPQRHYLAGSTPKWLSKAKSVGTTSSSEQVGFGVLLDMRNGAGAEATLKAISDPTSASYGKWLSNQAFDEQYAPAKTSVTAVQDWLRGQGFTVTQTLPSGMYVEASGSAAQVEKVFGSKLNNYSYQGKTVRANSSELSLPASTPAAVTGVVAGIVGVDQGTALKSPADTLPGPPPGARYGVQPCSAYYGQKIATDKPPAYGKTQPYTVCGYVPQQYQSAYGESSLLRAGVTGKGVTVAITDAYAAPTIYQDAQEYNRVHGQPLFTQGQFTQITPGANGYDGEGECGPQDWYGEETLDVEAVHAMAPGAKIVYVGALSSSDTDMDAALNWVVDRRAARIVSNSYGDAGEGVPADLIKAESAIFVQAAVEGIGLYFSSG